MTEEEAESVLAGQRTAVAAASTTMVKVRGQRSRNDWGRGRVEARGMWVEASWKSELFKVRWVIIRPA